MTDCIEKDDIVDENNEREGNFESELTKLNSNNDKVLEIGIGIPKDKIQAVFEPFNQVNNVDNSKIKGTGLGLAITKKT